MRFEYIEHDTRVSHERWALSLRRQEASALRLVRSGRDVAGGALVVLIGIACAAGAKRLALFHHDPVSSDEEIWQSKGQAEAYLMRRHSKCEVLVAYDGLSLGI